jgi:uncharacterized membrane protein
MIETEYTITYADYKAANRLYLLHRPRTMIGYLLLTWVLPTIAFCLLAWALWLQRHGDASVPFATPGSMVSYAVLVLFLPLSRWRVLRLGYRGLLPKGGQKIVRLTANEEQVVFTVPGRAEGRYFWKAIEDHAEDKNSLILIVSRTRYLIVPRHALNEAQWVQIRALIAMKVGQPMS